MQIPPWLILAGFGSLTRRELSDLLAVFEDAGLFNVVADRVKDLVRRGTDERVDTAAFRQRLQETADGIYRSRRSDAVLRLQLWHKTRETFHLDPAIPLSTRTANLRAADVAQQAADSLRDSIQRRDETSEAGILDRIRSRAESLFSRERADFSEVVGAHASIILAEAAEQGYLDGPSKDALLARVREQLRRAPPELRDRSIEQALKEGDATALKVLTGGSSLVGLGIAVELAGFSAYILAAQASAIIPLIGGKAVVSGLFILTHPLFIVPAVAGAGAFAARQFGRSVRTKLASSLTVQMALKGLSAGRAGLAACLDDFKSLTADDVDVADVGAAHWYNRKVGLIGDLVGGPLPSTPGRPPESLDGPPEGRRLDALEQVLFPDSRGAASGAMAVGGLTLADIVYHAAAIDPQVVRAADFSRSEDLSGIFEFGAFADRLGDLDGAALAGTEANLQGYVAEQIVATRLQEQGHQVGIPDAANNPGYDLVDDGIPCQVKCLNDIDGLVEHFERYPEVPVFVNGELAERIRESGHEWTDMVSFVEGYDQKTAETIMRESLDAGAALDNLDIPVFAVAVSAARNVHAWWKGSLPLQDLPFEVAVDGAVKGGLVVAGGFVGKSIGLLLFGPAGAVVFGAVGGTGALFGSGWARRQLDNALIAEWVRRFDGTSERFRMSLKATMRRKIGILKDKVDRLDPLDDELVSWIKQRLHDNALAIAECAAELEFDVVKHDQPERAKELLRLMRDAGVHPWSVQSDLTQVADCLAEKPSVVDVGRDHLKRVKSAFAKLDSIRGR